MAGIYIYPSRRGSYDCGLAAEWLKRMLPLMRQRSPGTPFMGIYQAFTGEHYTPKPTPTQVRKQVLDFAHFGASTLMAYSWRMVRDFKTLRNMPDLREEVARIAEDLLAGRIRLDQPQSDYPERPPGNPDLSSLVPLVTFDASSKRRLSASAGVSVERGPGPDGTPLLHLHFDQYSAGGPQWPSVRLTPADLGHTTDWSGAGWLVVKVRNFMPDESEIGITVRDSRGKPWWARYFPLPAGRSTNVYVSLIEMRRLIDLSDVALVTLLMRRPKVKTHLGVHGLYLAPVRFAKVRGAKYSCPRAVQPPTIDGDPSDECWRAASAARLRDEMLSVPPSQPVTLRATASQRRVCFLVECTVRDPSALCVTQGDGKRWAASDDTIELFVRSPKTKAWIKHVVNPAGRTKSQLFRPGKTDIAPAGVETASSLRNGRWIVEMSLDRTRLGDTTGTELGLNVRRRDRQLGPLIWAKDDSLPVGVEPLGTLTIE